MTLEELVREYLIEQGETEHKLFRFLQLGISGLREQHLDVSGTPTMVHLPVSDIDTITLPKDYIRYIRIGICGADGNIHSLGADPDMCFNKNFDKCGNPIPESTTGTLNTGPVSSAFIWGSWDGYADNFRNGELVGRFFGLGGGNNANGYYRVNPSEGVIQLGQLPRNTSEIALEYLADQKLIDGNFMVHPFIYEAIKAWIYWKSIQRNLRIGLGEKQLAKEDYYNAFRLGRARFFTETIAEWSEALRKQNKSVQKF